MIRSRTIRIIALALVVAALPTIGFLSRLQLSNTDSAPPEKQTFEARIQATDVAGRLTANAFLAMGTTGPKHPELQPAASCTQTPKETGIEPFRFGPFSDGRNMINEAQVQASTGTYYRIWAGAPDYFMKTGATQDPDARQEGLLRVLQLSTDPCADMAAHRSYHFMDYKTPNGPLTITQIDGDTVIFSIANGGTGRFNYLKGEFLP
jgi:hypothetical protein